jgi:hypothetical protein
MILSAQSHVVETPQLIRGSTAIAAVSRELPRSARRAGVAAHRTPGGT